jgi:hypothetical protein
MFVAPGNGRELRVAVAFGVGRERPLSRRRCASLRLGFDLVHELRLGPVCGARAVLRAVPMVGHKTIVEGRSRSIID